MRSSGVPHVRQITAWQSPHTRGSVTGRAHVGQYNSAADSGSGIPPLSLLRESGDYWAALMESTLMLLSLAFRVPITVTFLPANCSGVFWSLRV